LNSFRHPVHATSFAATASGEGAFRLKPPPEARAGSSPANPREGSGEDGTVAWGAGSITRDSSGCGEGGTFVGSAGAEGAGSWAAGGAAGVAGC